MSSFKKNWHDIFIGNFWKTLVYFLIHYLVTVMVVAKNVSSSSTWIAKCPDHGREGPVHVDAVVGVRAVAVAAPIAALMLDKDFLKTWS